MTTSRTSAPTPGALGRRGLLTAIGAGLTATVVAACTNSELDDAEASDPTTTPAGSATADSTAAAYPVTVTHRFGETTISAEPQRVLALGQTDCDPLLALGVVPIAVGSFVDDWYEPVHPWNESLFGGEPKEVSFTEVDFEEILALAPDLITMVSGGITQAQYRKLSKIAPVVGPPVGYQDSAVPYGPHTLLIGQALGKEPEAQQLVDDADAAFAAVREAHPEWASLTATHAECYSGAFDILGANAPRTTFLVNVGFGLSEELTDIVGDDYIMDLSAEKLDLVGALDLVVWCTDEGAIPDVQDNAVVAELAAVKAGHCIWTTYGKDDQFMWAMDWGTVLSAQHAIDLGVPLIESALAGESPISDGNA
ncbi:ABC transporter substrate-binding protein [Nocardioides sp.]|uniref:ABC transporter substrate-binding protein n=1 Tax=Nocardioides sp. TaxID=35761 RepID=UPI0039E3A9EF